MWNPVPAVFWQVWSWPAVSTDRPLSTFPRRRPSARWDSTSATSSVGDFQPMNINFGIIPPLDHRVKGKRNKNAELSRRSLDILSQTIEQEVLYT